MISVVILAMAYQLYFRVFTVAPGLGRENNYPATGDSVFSALDPAATFQVPGTTIIRKSVTVPRLFPSHILPSNPPTLQGNALSSTGHLQGDALPPPPGPEDHLYWKISCANGLIMLLSILNSFFWIMVQGGIAILNFLAGIFWITVVVGITLCRYIIKYTVHKNARTRLYLIAGLLFLQVGIYPSLKWAFMALHVWTWSMILSQTLVLFLLNKNFKIAAIAFWFQIARLSWHPSYLLLYDFILYNIYFWMAEKWKNQIEWHPFHSFVFWNT